MRVIGKVNNIHIVEVNKKCFDDISYVCLIVEDDKVHRVLRNITIEQLVFNGKQGCLIYKIDGERETFSEATANTLVTAIKLMKDYSLSSEDILTDVVKSYCDLWDEHQRYLYVEE